MMFFSSSSSSDSFQVSNPSLNKKITIINPTTESTFQRPKRELKPKPNSKATERKAQTNVSFESAIRARLCICMPVLYFCQVNSGITMREVMAIDMPPLIVTHAKLDLHNQ